MKIKKGSPEKAIKSSFIIDESYLRSLGEIIVPRIIWQALLRYDVWIEPVLLSEWTKLIKNYGERQKLSLKLGDIATALSWSEPERDTSFTRNLALKISQKRPLYCVWSGKKLSDNNLDIDHCLPWSAWPCNDLWNLMPSDRTINQKQKRDKLPSNSILMAAKERILSWWEEAYSKEENLLSYRFYSEAQSSLPRLDNSNLDEIFLSLGLKRISLQKDQQIEEWERA